MNKVIPVAGDVTMPSLGISPEDLKLLCDDVSVVFNSAATVRFDEDLRTAVELNVKGPQRLMNVCHQMKRLEVSYYFIYYFIHSSIHPPGTYFVSSLLLMWSGPGSRPRFHCLQ